MVNKQLLKRILTYAKPYVPLLVLALLSAVISVSMTLFAPVLVGEAIDYIVGAGDVSFAEIGKILIRLGIVIALTALFQWIMSLCTNKISYGSMRDLRRDVFHKLNKLPLKYSDRNPHGDIISRVVTDIELITDGMLQGFNQLFTGIVTILGTLIFMLKVNYKIALVVILITPLSLFVAYFISRRSFKMFQEQAVLRGEIGGCSEEYISEMKFIKTFGYESEAYSRFEEINSRLNKVGLMAQFYSAMTNPSTRFVNGIVYAAVGVTGALSAIEGRMSVGQISVFLSYANQYTKPFNEISGVLNELQNAFASARRVFAVLDEEEEPQDDCGIETSQCDGSVKISHVDFSYIPERPLIENFNLEVRKGERIAIVGPTGCGKTTLINLLMRFYDTTAGSIIISGTEVKDWKRSGLRSKFGMVLQETWLFSGTIAENIAYGKENATREEIVAAAKLAHAHGFIRRLPKGYDTPVSESGGNLSQGQKQLLCIARVMLTKPPMLILDEATSSIDTRTEIRIQKAFNTMMEGRTSFIVAHRLSTIKEADVILVMNAGNVIEQGNHEELLKKGGFYANLYNSQFEPAE